MGHEACRTPALATSQKYVHPTSGSLQDAMARLNPQKAQVQKVHISPQGKQTLRHNVG